MAAIITRATVTHNVNSEHDIVEIHYIKPNFPKKVTFVDSFPNGNWTDIKFDPDDEVLATDFLHTMVFKNLDVSRKIASLSLERIIEHTEVSWPNYIQTMCAMRILDPTFEPPHINLNCRWQKDLLESIVERTSRTLISTCKNADRLDRYSNALNNIRID
jgi:hypothetical protein